MPETDDNPSTSPPAVALRGVTKDFGAGPVLKNFSVDARPGRPVALIGPSGCGKSTALRLMLGLERPTSGEVELLGEPVQRGPGLRSLRQRVGYVIQSGGLFPHLTAHENAELPAKLARRSPADRAARTAELTELVGLDADTLARFPHELSGGQRQRVALMRALALSPELLLLDEPLGALDPMIRASLQTDLRRIFDRLGTAVVLVTHDLHEAAFLCDEIALMRDGELVQRGPMRELADHPADPFVPEFIDAQHARPAAAATARSGGGDA